MRLPESPRSRRRGRDFERQRHRVAPRFGAALAAVGGAAPTGDFPDLDR